ncbi:MAG: M56 family metallopeptidase, partial [Lachnospiraceae bacterium]
MDNIFLYVVKMSLTAGCVVPVVLLIRLLLKKAPKKYSYLLWSVVGFRLLCPVSFTSRISFFNIGIFDFFRSDRSSINKGMQDLAAVGAVQGNAAGATVNMGMGQTVDVVGNVIPRGDFTENIVQPIADSVSAGSSHSINTLLSILTVVWLAGVIVMFTYGMVSYLTLVWKLRKAVRVSGKENVYRSEIIGTPFIMGIMRPVIYIPGYLQGDDAKYVLLHEECHIRRFDYAVKLVAFILLCIHWFNPLMWLAFCFMNKDMEMSCDEKVLEELGGSGKKNYSMSLL